MRRCLWLLLLLCAGAPPADDPAPFAPPWDDASPGPVHQGAGLHRPAGSLGPVRVKDGRLEAGGRRIRFFGANFTAGACFPDHDAAGKIAARLAKFGFNAVRLHFLEATWGEPRLVDYASGDWTRWNAGTLDRLDYFVSKLREQGIYINMNLLVGRRFGEGDGVDKAVQRLGWKEAHAVGFFHAPHREAQKDYARRLLGHRNPYTKLTYAEDPAVAFVEINNENGLIHTWMGGGFEGLPEPFAEDLRRQWNAWLAARHPDSAALAKAWGARNDPPGAELLVNADLADGLRPWTLEQHAGAKASVRAEDGAAVLRVEKSGSEAWHVQFNQPGLKVARGAVYTAAFRASADRPRKVSVALAQAHAPWAALGLQAELALDREPRTHRFTFVAPDDDAAVRFGFSGLSQEGAEFRFGALSLKPGGRVGLAEGEALEQRNVGLPSAARGRRLPEPARLEWIRFLWETERACWRDLHRFLRDELRVQGLVAGTIVATSTPTLMADLDVVDTHAYWEHPRFPGRDWDMDNWIVRNRSMADFPAEATITRLALQRVAGKPHMVSEYNHPAPNPHAGEGPLFLAAAAGWQDWDALFLYTYAHDERGIKAGRIPGFFDVGQHPTIMANALVASLMFRRGDLAPAGRRLSIPLSPERELGLVAGRGAAWNVLPVANLGVDPAAALLARTELDLAAPPDAPTPAAPAAEASPGPFSWRKEGPKTGLFEVRTPQTKLLVGHVDGRTIDLGHGVQVTVGTTSNGWCTLALTLLEGDSFEAGRGRALIVATGHAENTGMGWKDAEKSTVGRDWGKAPSRVELVPATIQLPRRAGAPPPLVHVLDERGQRAGSVPVEESGGAAARFRIGAPHATLWYEVEFR